MYLLIHSSGSKYWRLNFRLNGKQKTHAIGKYPDISLKEARIQRDEARLLIRKEIDPTDQRRQQAARLDGRHSFEHLAEAWMDNERGWRDSYRKDVKQRLKCELRASS